MIKLNFIRLKNAFVVVLTACALAVGASGQTSATAAAAATAKQAEPNYEVVLQVLSASNNSAAGGKTAEAVPSSLAGVVKRLKTMYSFSHYQVNLTYFQRIANRGNLEFKGVLSGASQQQDVYAPIFSNFSFGQLSTLPAPEGAGGASSISIQNFYFGQRVPIKTATITSGDGKSNAVINYEQVGLSMQKIGLPVNQPTIIGNLSASKPDELTFLILTVKPTEN